VKPRAIFSASPAIVTFTDYWPGCVYEVRWSHLPFLPIELSINSAQDVTLANVTASNFMCKYCTFYLKDGGI